MDSCRLKIQAVRGTSSYTTEYLIYFYGTDLTVTYTYQNEKFMLKLGGEADKLPEGHTQLEYIESTGEQYINLGFVPDSNTRVVYEFEVVKEPSATLKIFAARTSSTYQFCLAIVPGSGYRTDYGGTRQSITSVPVLGHHVVDKNKNVTTIDGVSVTNTAETFSTGYPLVLFGQNDSGTINELTAYRLKHCMAYNNGTLIRDCYPDLNPSNVPGLYDLVNGVFYPSATSTPFVAGPVYNKVWHDIARVFKKISGIWVEQEELANVIEDGIRYKNGGEYMRPVTFISFTIEGASYQAEEGMTWAEWCESDYNTDGYSSTDRYIYTSDGFWTVTSGSGFVGGTDLIESGGAYSLST